MSSGDFLEDAVDCGENEDLLLPDGARLSVTKVGKVRLKSKFATILLTEAYYAPKLAKKLISLGNLKKKGCTLRTPEER